MQMTHNFSSPSIHQISTPTYFTYKMLYNRSLPGSSLLLTLNSSKTELLLRHLARYLHEAYQI